MGRGRTWLAGCLIFLGAVATEAAPPALSDDFPPTEERGGWRSLLPESGEPDSTRKAKIRETTGVDWDKLKEAWLYNTRANGATGLLVIRKGQVVGEWYRGGDRSAEFNIYSSSKAYTSTAFGLILGDFGAGPLPGGRSLTLDTKVCNPEWLPESLPLPDPRKAGITVRHLLNMASGIGGEPVPAEKGEKPFEVALGKTRGSAFRKLKGDPGTVFNYSNAGVAHLVLVFNHAQRTDLFPFLKERLLDPIGMKQVRWQTIGGDGGAIGPYAQGYSGIYTTPREHARFCYLALHKGEWAGKRVVPESYYDFAWAGTKVKADYGAQWWTAEGVPGAPADLVMTKGKNHNDGFVIPSLDLVFVRLGDGGRFPEDFERDLVLKVVAAVEK
ncbi:MAG: beta-lactamase family protein [Planctomycetia bacterium]|nr:beta-lactamase family protein [Planctomycetia bacterium]